MSLENNNKEINWSLYAGKEHQSSKEYYEDLMRKLHDINGELLSPFKKSRGEGSEINISIDRMKLNIIPNVFTNHTYKIIKNFKNKVEENKDRFIEFIRTNENGYMIAKIRTCDNEEMEIATGDYCKFIEGRKYFLNNLNEVYGRLLTTYKGSCELITIQIDDAIISTTSVSFNSQIYSSILNFKNKLKTNKDIFIKFKDMTENNGLLAEIITFDGGNIQISIGKYNDFLNGRKTLYDKVNEINAKLLTPYKGDDELIDVQIDDVIIKNVMSKSFKNNIYKSVKNFKAKLDYNEDKLMKFIDINSHNTLIARIKTVDNAEKDIVINKYPSFVKSRLDFFNKLKEIGGKALTPYRGNESYINIEIDDAKWENATSATLKSKTIPTIKRFKEDLEKQGDKLVKFINFSIENGLTAQIKTFDSAIIDITLNNYNSFIKSRLDFFNKLKEIDGKVLTPYRGDSKSIDLNVWEININNTSPATFKRKIVPTVEKFKVALKNNKDVLIKFIDSTKSNGLLAKIKTFDGGEVNISIGNYISFSKSRAEFYSVCNKNGIVILSPYLIQEPILLDFECKHEPQWCLVQTIKRAPFCKLCRGSLGEKQIYKVLTDMNILYDTNKRFHGLKYKAPLRVDVYAYIEIIEIPMENDGVQHFEIINFRGDIRTPEQLEYELSANQFRDRIKNKYFKEKNKFLLRIPYSVELSKYENIIKKHIIKVKNFQNQLANNLKLVNCEGIEYKVSENKDKKEVTIECLEDIRDIYNEIIISNKKLNFNISTIGRFSFANFGKLKKVYIKSNVTIIQSSAFYGCVKLEFIELPSTLRKIESFTFAHCVNLKEIKIPNSVLSIEEYAFTGCSENLIIYGQKDSYAQTYAKKNKIKFKEFK